MDFMSTKLACLDESSFQLIVVFPMESTDWCERNSVC